MASRDPLHPDELRRIAEKRIASDPGATLEELHIHQVELELQHAELQRIYGELSDSHDRYRQLFQDGPLAYVRLDERGVVQQANGQAELLLGPCTNVPLDKFLEDGESPYLENILRDGTEPDRGRSSTELRMQTFRGVRLLRLTSTRGPAGMLIALEDVTRMRETQERLANSERRLRTFFDLAPDAIAVLRNGKLVFVNRALCLLLQTTAESLMDRGLSQAVIGERDVFALPGSPVVEFLMRDAEGGEHAVEGRAVSIELDDGPARMWMLRDLTERRRMEARVARSERLASFGMLVSGVAHEINNPLAFVLGNIEMLVDELEASGQRELIELGRDALEAANESRRSSTTSGASKRPTTSWSPWTSTGSLPGLCAWPSRRSRIRHACVRRSGASLPSSPTKADLPRSCSTSCSTRQKRCPRGATSTTTS